MARVKTPRNNTRSKATAEVTEMKLVPETKKSLAPQNLNLEEEIRRRAYELYEQRGCVAGYDHEDWLVAERQILDRYNQRQRA